MAKGKVSRVGEILAGQAQELLNEWMADLSALPRPGGGRIGEAELREQSGEFLRLLTEAVRREGPEPADGGAWSALREFLSDVSRSRALQGYSPTETATFVFSFKQPLFRHLRQELQKDPEALTDEMWSATLLLDTLGLWTVEAFQRAREEVIQRQQEELLELSTPVVKLWDGVLALPIIGTLDSARTQVVMESLLQMIVETGSETAIIDITGVPTVDTLVAQHLLKTVTAARLMGADCIISGIRPQIAQTIVHLGVDLQDVVTKATLADAFSLALRRNGVTFSRAAAPK